MMPQMEMPANDGQKNHNRFPMEQAQVLVMMGGMNPPNNLMQTRGGNCKLFENLYLSAIFM